MGIEESKQEKNIKLRRIGQEANKKDPQEFQSFTAIKITNELLVSESESDPDKEYKKLKFLGEGSFGAVYQVRNRYTGAISAMKIIKKISSYSREEEDEIKNEINILRTMDHPNILKIFEFYSNKEKSI